ncbi:MAG TPA: hypothetical protein VHM67_14165 [Gemmatimonadaceae bacterium]|nr:hypothetical protein [Gemmatimonadaceae bacterium]
MSRYFVVLLFLATLGCASAPRGVNEPGAPTPALAVERFMAAAKAQDLQALAVAWGSAKGPARSVVPKDQIERRELIMICYLTHDSYTVQSDTPAPEGRRAFTIELRRGPIARKTTLTTVKGPSNRYYVSDVALEPLSDLCATSGKTLQSPTP